MSNQIGLEKDFQQKLEVVRTRTCFSVKDLTLKETFSRDGIAKYLIELPDQYKYDNLICLVLVSDENWQCKEQEVKVQIQTFKILLN